MTRLLALLLIVLALPARAEQIVLGLSQDAVAITATYSGSEIIVFGAVKRDAPAPADSTLGVIVTISGPEEPITVWRKERRLGIWVNAQSARIARAPSFYAVASSAPLRDIVLPGEDVRNAISIPRAIGVAQGDSPFGFGPALIRVKTEQGLYQLRENTVDLDQDTLFRTSVLLPANLTDGLYTVQIYLTRDGRVIDALTTDIAVAKVGLERWLFNLAHEQAFFYGLLSLAIAIGAGWIASAVFGLLRR